MVENKMGGYSPKAENKYHMPRMSKGIDKGMTKSTSNKMHMKCNYTKGA